RRGARWRLQERRGIPLPRTQPRRTAGSRGALPARARLGDALARVALAGGAGRARPALAAAPGRWAPVARRPDRRPREGEGEERARAQGDPVAAAAPRDRRNAGRGRPDDPVPQSPRLLDAHLLLPVRPCRALPR